MPSICILLSHISLSRYPGMPSICLDGLVPEQSPQECHNECWVVSYNRRLNDRQNGEERAHIYFLLCQEPTHSVRRWLTSGKRLRKEELLASSALAHPRVLEEPDPARPESKPQRSEDVLTERGC